MRHAKVARLTRANATSPWLNLFAWSIGVAAALLATQAKGATPCADLVTLQLPDAVVTSAATVSGKVRGPDGKNYTGLPSFCQVTIVATPTNDSAINILLWIPDNTWNGRFQGTGNGGYAGNMAIDTFAMVYAVKHGFAVVASDMGTAPSSNNNADTLIGHPQKWIDWGSRSTYLMSALGKRVVRAFHGRTPTYSYFNGCSTGGQQALLLAQKYPNLYDGILAGAPAHDRTHVHTSVLWLFAKTHEKPTSYITSDKVTLINNAIIAACRAQSGGAPGDTWLTDPRKCDWRPSELRCTSPGQSNCLSNDQVAAATAIYAGPRDPVTGERIFPGAAKGSEAASSFGWNAIQASVEPNFGSLFKWVFGPNFTYMDFDFHHDMNTLDRMLERHLNVTNPDLSEIPGARRQALDVSRLGRPADRAAKLDRLLHKRGAAREPGPRHARPHAGLLPAVHGARHEPLLWRPRAARVRQSVLRQYRRGRPAGRQRQLPCAQSADVVGGARPRTGENHRDQVRQRHDVGRHRDAASAVSLPQDRHL